MKRAWTSADILPSGGSLTLLGIATTTDGMIVEADGPGSARCPSCRHPSVARHSRYWRTIKDLPAHGQAVILRVRVGRWRCQNARCARAIFADRLDGVAAPRLQHTDRLGAIVHLVGHALGGRAGERLLARLGMTIGADTIVCLVKRGAPAATPDATLRVLGIDDWAWQKGQQHFGTILVDLERRRVVDVLAVRTADAVSAWLAAHPGIRIISRDRHGPYADAVRRGAPQATQVADRFHLVLNLRGAVQQELGRQRRFLVVPHSTPMVTVRGRPPARSPMVGRRQRSKVLEHDARVAEERRATQLARFRLVKRLQAAGRSAQAIMRETGIGRRFVTNWIRLNDVPERNRMDPRVGMAEFYREYLLRRWREGCQIGRVLLGEIQTLGYVGSYAGLAKLLAPWRHDAPLHRRRAGGAPVASVFTRHVSPQIAAALLSQPRPLLSARQVHTVDALKERCPGFTTMRRLVLSFRTILRVGTVPTLHRWLMRAEATKIEPLQRFVRTLRHDLGAVEGAVREPWSNGPVEGHINRLKMLRRQMYGRGSVELLRARLLPVPFAGVQ
jgi:transposase